MNETKRYWRKSSRKNFLDRFISAFANTLHHGFCNHFADAIANDQIIEHWIEFVRRERLLRL
jgi:hypothetical protein